MAVVATIHDDLYRTLDLLDGVGTIYLKTGEYILTRPLDINGHINLIGAGANTTIITYVGAGPAIRINTGTGLGAWNWSIQDLTVKGNDVGYYGIKIGQEYETPYIANKGVIKDCVITGFAVAGLLLASSQSNRFYNLNIHDNPGAGILITNLASDGNIDNVFTGCLIKENGSYGLEGYNGVHTTFRDCIFESNTDSGVYLRVLSDNGSNRSSMFDRCYFNLNGGEAQFEIGSDANEYWTSTFIDHCHFTGLDNTSYHISVDKVDLIIRNPDFLPATTLGKDNGDSESYVQVVCKLVPGWELGGINSPVLWKQEDKTYGTFVYINDGTGNWIRRDIY